MLHLGRAGSDLHELDKRYITGYTSTADMLYWVLKNCLHSKVCFDAPTFTFSLGSFGVLPKDPCVTGQRSYSGNEHHRVLTTAVSNILFDKECLKCPEACI